MADTDQPRQPRWEPRTGAEQPWEPEDLVAAEGKDPTPHNLEDARRRLVEEGPAAIEKIVP
jgi:hypothetical protein